LTAMGPRGSRLIFLLSPFRVRGKKADQQDNL